MSYIPFCSSILSASSKQVSLFVVVKARCVTLEYPSMKDLAPAPSLVSSQERKMWCVGGGSLWSGPKFVIIQHLFCTPPFLIFNFFLLFALAAAAFGWSSCRRHPGAYCF